MPEGHDSALPAVALFFLWELGRRLAGGGAGSSDVGPTTKTARQDPDEARGGVA